MAVARHLIAAAPASEPCIDLRAHRVVIPSHYAARLVHEQLALQAPAGVLPPQFQTPNDFLNLGYTANQVAAPTDELMAWIEVLLGTERTTLTALLPHASTGCFELTEARHLAQVFTALREELGMSEWGRDFAAVAHLPGNPEPARWEDLARLEASYRQVLRERGYEDRNDARVAAAAGTHIPNEFSQLWLAGLTEPQPLFLKAVARMEAIIPIHVVVGAPEEETGFDPWGRPDPLAWRERRTPWETFNQGVHVVRDPDEALSLLRTLVGGVGPAGGLHAVCACDREVEAPRIGAVIRALGGEALDTLGVPHGSHFLHHGLKVWARLIGSSSPDLALMREAMHLPALAAAVATHAKVAGGVDYAFQQVNTCLDAVDRAFFRGSLDQTISQLEALAADEGTDPSPTRERQQIEDARRVLLAIRAFIAPLRGLASLCTSLWRNRVSAALISVTLITAAEKRFRQSDVDNAVNLPGWLEAPWDPAPHLIIHGLNDHLLPRADHAHPFLPGQLRALVGLPSNEQTFAAAAFALEQIRRRRETNGWVDVIVPQTATRSGLRGCFSSPPTRSCRRE